jgi:chromosome segregation ATPase|nr:MAG TPA: DivIVA protein [Caudoviricetes sp.]
MFAKKDDQEEMPTATLKHELRRMANLYKAAEKGLEMAAKLETLENSIALRQNEEKKAREDLQAVQAEIAAAEEAKTQAQQDALNIINNAQQQAKEITAKAEAAGEKLIVDTEDDLNGVKADIDQLTARRDELQAQNESLEAQIAEANKTIDDIQSKAAKVLGGLPKGAQ